MPLARLRATAAELIEEAERAALDRGMSKRLCLPVVLREHVEQAGYGVSDLEIARGAAQLDAVRQGEGVAAIEIMLNSPLMSDLIFKGEVHEMKSLIARSRELGMQTFDQALFDLFEADLITYEDALRNADSVNDLRLKIKLESKNAKNRDLGSGLEHLEIVK